MWRLVRARTGDLDASVRASSLEFPLDAGHFDTRIAVLHDEASAWRLKLQEGERSWSA